ncbi:hypothetical protein EDC18_106121 [Natranaerovirga pectinivora]|uniref:Nitrogen regulatory protein P-II family n=1 Tax=Natranaerovirga pectinivora TaxID=682400 RepID=A0A4R3MKT4_9FIRM|nr:hypothetical protein [Natranaerovirga pectinivora]TCT14323.1 hypothetical protein EDC18_106121 [Natranaerovirga pectinivora]
MYVLFVVLNETEYLSDVLIKIRQLGIRGATVIESVGATSIDKGIYSLPVIGGFMRTLDGDSSTNRTIFSVIENEKEVEKAMEEVEKVLGGDLKKPHKGIMFVLPVTHFRGGELQRHIEDRENKKIIEKEYESEYY